MIYTHIFLVILSTVILIIFAEYQKLRKITWILCIGCVTYILLIIEPETKQPTNNANDGITRADSLRNSDYINHATKSDTVVKDIIEKSINTDIKINNKTEVVTEEQNLEILTLNIATDIIEKTPICVSRLFFNDINKLFCYTIVNNPIKNNKIIHNWIYNDQDYFSNIIRIGNSPNWRCWSMITIRPEMTGDWQVIITDTIGNHLDSIDFSIIPTHE